MKKIWKTTLREITGSFGRYVAILMIVMLGVGFFSGLKTARPYMFKIVNGYVNDYNLYDFRILSTLGIEEEDIQAAAELPFVTAAEGSVAFDVLTLSSVSEDNSERVLHVQSLTNSINVPRLMEGRMPQAPNEVLADSLRFGKDSIGETILISDNNTESTLDMLKYDEYVIVGLVTEVYYMNFERGTASIGNGQVAGFIYMPMDAIDSDYYTELFVKTRTTGGVHTDEYKDEIDSYRDEVEAFAESVAARREKSIQDEANEKIADAQADIDDGKKKLADAEEELADGRKKLEDAKKEVEDGWKKLHDGEADIKKAQKEVNDAQKELDAKALELEEGIKKYEEGKAQLEKGQKELENGYAQLEQMKLFMPSEMYEAQRLQLDEKKVQVEEGLKTLKTTKKQLDDGAALLEDGKKQLSDAKKEIAKGQKEIDENRIKLQDAEEEIAENEEKIIDGEQEIADAKVQIEDGEDELADAKKKLDDMDEALSYALDRMTNVGYVCFESDSSIVDQVAGVFPIFFFLVAALVCMTTMNRMVEDQRTQVGIMKALGYGNGKIMLKYMVYSGSAALIGGLGGFFLGSFVFPRVIWTAYRMMYSVGGETFVIDPMMGVLTVFVALICCMGTTYLTLRGALTEVPAGLLRPKAPTSGKKILLERLTFLWKHMSFMNKVSARNIFRYKKRLFMMIVGISGCTALLITGLGLRDSIVGVVPEQYDNIQKYDASLTLKDAFSDEEYVEFMSGFPQVKGSEELAVSSVDVTANGKTKSITLIIPKDDEAILDYVHLFDTSGVDIAYPQNGEAVVTHKAAERLNIHVGDTISFMDEDLHTISVKVSGICRNYISDFVYLNEETYENAHIVPEYKTVWCKFDESVDAHELGASLIDSDEVVAINISQDLRARVDGMMGSLTYVILLVVVSAALLAFIVLYNLTNINITERLREIATIKVLGFYPGETAMYVFKENLVLTAFGAIAGIFLGRWLHDFVMDCINVDGVAFHNDIGVISFVASVVMTFAFAIVVDIFMFGKLQRIDMAESLKSIE